MLSAIRLSMLKLRVLQFDELENQANVFECVWIPAYKWKISMFIHDSFSKFRSKTCSKIFSIRHDLYPAHSLQVFERFAFVLNFADSWPSNTELISRYLPFFYFNLKIWLFQNFYQTKAQIHSLEFFSAFYKGYARVSTKLKQNTNFTTQNLIIMWSNNNNPLLKLKTARENEFQNIQKMSRLEKKQQFSERKFNWTKHNWTFQMKNHQFWSQSKNLRSISTEMRGE